LVVGEAEENTEIIIQTAAVSGFPFAIKVLTATRIFGVWDNRNMED
jgi:hypothetical protein